MGQAAIKKQRKFLKHEFSEKIESTAKTLITGKVESEINKFKKISWQHARQRDIFIVISFALLIAEIFTLLYKYL